MDRTLHLLVVGHGDTLRDEFDAALAGVPNHRPVTHHVGDLRHAVAAARSRQPDLICVEMARDTRMLTTFAREVGLVAPDAVVAAVYDPSQLAASESEGAIIIEALRARVQDFLRRPLSSTELRQLLDRVAAMRTAVPSVAAGTVVSFISNKGGVGKTTLAVSTACALAQRHPGQVLLIDASLQLGICALMLDLPTTPSIVDAVRDRDRLDETLLRRLSLPHAAGVRLLAAPTDAVEAASVDDEAIARVLTLARRAFDFVIVDTFPMLDSVVMAILDVSDRAFLVFQGTGPCVAGTARFLPVLDGLHVPTERQRLVLNQNYRSFAGNLTVADIESRLGREVDFAVPYQRRLMPAMNTGEPYVLRATRRWGFGRAIDDLVTSIETLRHEGLADAEPGARALAADGGREPV
ncbi:MAG: AAA family ATPase [Acidobacteria bacterium]|nr:AAA family ATPase [Acidobacteriota bacterium]